MVQLFPLGASIHFRWQPGSAAEEAGVQPTRRDANGRLVLGDIIVAVNNAPIMNSDDLWRQLDDKEVGDLVTLTLKRPRGRTDVQVRLQAMQ